MIGSLTGLAKGIDALNRSIGGVVSWLALCLVLLQFTIVVLRYVFGVGSIQMQEGVVYLHGMLFMLAAGYTLLAEGHVRVDIFYRDAPPKRKAMVDLLGSLALLLPVITLILWVSFPYVERSWAVFEGSKETSGIHAVFLLKSVILIFGVLVFLQGASKAIHAFLILTGREEPTSNAPSHEL